MGHPQRLMTDYQHVVDTMAESEGLGSYTEMTLSEESCSPKRKCISLNGDSNDRFGVPVQVLSFSKMSRSERRDLKLRLRSELEKVRILRQRFASFSTNAVILSPSSDIRSCTDGHNRPPLEGTPKLTEHPSQGKKRLPPGRNGPRTKKGFLGHVENPKQAAPSMNTSNTMLVKQCENLLSRLMSHQFGWVFNTPVDVVKLNIPDYFTVIKHPMDLGTIKSKLARGEYSNPADFAADVRLTFSNAMTYNPPGNNVHIMALTLSKHFEQRWKVIEKKIPTNTDSHVLPLMRKDSQVHKAAVSDHILPSSKKKKLPPMGCMGKLEPVKRVMTNEEKHKLSTELEALLGELPESVIDFLKANSSGAGQTSEDEIEIDIDALSDDVLFKLRKLLDDFVLEKKQQAKGEQCEMELHHESGFSNSSIPPGKGNDPLDEDVDIGGNDQPVSSIPQVEIERDTAHKDSRCSGPTSSSSGDSSSSSDSDSRSSHSSESEGRKAVQQGHKLQGTANAEQNLEENKGEVDQDIGRKQSGSTFSHVEENPQCNPPSVKVDDPKEGERAPPGSQVSSDKLYRAALLKSRFADTIFKAQEKTLDPEKLRLEREELEKRRREEKARLQAEAKAAEKARKKAEAEAAAEAKRKRELEREAARLALQKMEKTVDINENCQFMEDLEMLKAAPDDNLLTFMDDNAAVPDDSPDARLGSFRLRGNTNPLEQLGLFMKDDDEEEEEVDVPHSGPIPDSNDVEEGEID